MLRSSFNIMIAMFVATMCPANAPCTVDINDESGLLMIGSLLASTYLGGSGSELAFPRIAAAVGEDGSVYVVGYTTSQDFPSSATFAQGGGRAGEEAFVARFSSDLSELLGLAILAGSGTDRATSVALDGTGRVYVGGHTESTDFPYTTGAYDTLYNGTGSCPYGNGDVFVARFDSELESLQACTFLGGSGADYSFCMTLDMAGNVYVSGSTASGNFPFIPGVYDSTHSPGGNFGLDVFVSRFDPDLEELTSSSFLGGPLDDYSEAIVMAESGDVYISGWTASSYNFPWTSGCYDSTYGGGYYDAFISKLDGELTELQASTYLGGSYWDMVYSMCLDNNGNVFVTGHTASKYSFPYTSDAYDTTYNGSLGQGTTDDCFVSKFDSGLETLLASTFLGGFGWEMGFTMTIDDSGYIYVANHTNSSSFPTSPVTYDSDYNGGQHDVALSRFDNSLSELSFSTFLGGDGRDYYPGLALDGVGNVCVAGLTGSADFPYSPGAYDTTLGGSRDVFVSIIPGTYFLDSDGDGFVDITDNCPSVPNPGQDDADGDTNGDSCDVCPGFDDYADADVDLVPDGCDTCTDTDGDGYGNPGYLANTCENDNCPEDYNPDQADADGDGVGDACCCFGMKGSVQILPNCDLNDQTVDISDLTNMIDHLFISYTPLCCPAEADIAPAISGGQPDDVVDISDLTAMIDHLFINYPSLPECP